MAESHFFTSLLDLAGKQGYSDIHLSSGVSPIIRDAQGDIVPLSDAITQGVLSYEQILGVLQIILTPDGYTTLMHELEYDTSYRHTDGLRYRVNCFKDANGYAVAMRQISEKIPTLSDLGLGETIESMCSHSKGLILMTGPTGTGKSTNLAAMIDAINASQKKHIITIEDPIEYVFKNNLSHINQREVGVHTKSFQAAIKSALREDPDVIMIGEMRDMETIQAAVTLAETGHLVLSTLHTNDTVQSIDRIVDIFPEGKQEQIRMQLAMSLIGVVSQRLMPRSDAPKKIAAREILLNNDAVKNLIITKKTHQIYSVIETSMKHGMILMDDYLKALYKKGHISSETVISYSRDRDSMKSFLQSETK